MPRNLPRNRLGRRQPRTPPRQRRARNNSRYHLLARQNALGRLRSAVPHRPSARRTYAAIRQRAWHNLRRLLAALNARAVVRRAVRRRIARRPVQQGVGRMLNRGSGDWRRTPY